MRIEPTPETLHWMFMGGGEKLASRPWESSEQEWVWSLRYLCWRYLMYAITDDWTPTEDCYELPEGPLANHLRRAVLLVLESHDAICARRNLETPEAIEFTIGTPAKARKVVMALWYWLTENSPQLGAPPIVGLPDEDELRASF